MRERVRRQAHRPAHSDQRERASPSGTTPALEPDATVADPIPNTVLQRILDGGSPIPLSIQRLTVGASQWVRGDGGSIASTEERALGTQPAGVAPTAPDELAIVANVPTARTTASEIATRYAEGWGDATAMARRQRLVIGANTFQSLGESLDAAKARAEAPVKDAMPAGAIGTAVIMVWRPAWNKPWPANPLTLDAPQRDRERTEVLDRTKIPYGTFRSAILSSQATSTYAQAFGQAGYRPYVHVSDPDSASFKVPAGRQRPGGAKTHFAGAFDAVGNEGLFDRLAALVDRRRRDRGAGQPRKEFPAVVAGGYQFRDPTIPLTRIAGQIDMQVRRVLFSKGRAPTAAYLPEPNLFVNWADIPKQATAPGRAIADVFGPGSGESPRLMTAIIAELTKRGIPPAEIRRRVAFKPAAAVETGASGGGERFRARTEQPKLLPAASRPAAGMSIEDAYESVLRSGQSHANPNTWPTKALAAAGLDKGPENVNLRRARYWLRHLAGGDAIGTKIQALAGLGTQDPKPPGLSAADDITLRDMAQATIDVIRAYHPAINALIANA